MAKRTRINRPYPTHSIQDTLPIAETIQRVNGGRPVRTELLAGELGTSAKSSAFMQKLNSSSKYGLTVGSYSDEYIQLTELGEALTAPSSAQEKNDSMLEAVAKPDIFRKFYRMYAGKRMPEDIYASNTLAREMGVPWELTEECLGIIRRNGLVSGLVSDLRGELVVRAISDSEEETRYSTAPHEEIEPDRTAGDIGEARVETRRRDDILIVCAPDDSVGDEAIGLLEAMSAPYKTVSLNASERWIVSPELADALETTRGCVFVWPADPDSEHELLSGPAVWSALGALSYQLGDKLIILIRDENQATGHPAADDPAATVIGVGRGESVYPALMSALVQSGTVKVSVG